MGQERNVPRHGEAVVSYVRATYGTCPIIFDGYQDGPSIKDHEHQSRASEAGAEIHEGSCWLGDISIEWRKQEPVHHITKSLLSIW